MWSVVLFGVTSVVLGGLKCLVYSRATVLSIGLRNKLKSTATCYGLLCAWSSTAAHIVLVLSDINFNLREPHHKIRMHASDAPISWFLSLRLRDF